VIIHSTANRLDDTCLVRVEGIPPGNGDPIVKLFAQGAAGKHNAGYDIRASGLQWCEDDGTPIPEGYDTTYASVALVLCRVDKP
jgi:hypothetical protein